MSYPYTAENRLDIPHNYMYAPYNGKDFLAAYVTDRRRRLALHLQGAICPPQGTLKSALSTAARCNLEARPLDAFSQTECTPLQPLLASLLSALAAGNAVAAHPWLIRVIQRFEVSKKLYATYASGFRKGEGDARDPARYVELALCLALGHSLTGQLQYLSTLLKLVDLLLSLSPDTLRPACPPERLALLVAAELDAVAALATEQEVTIDVL